MLKDRDYVEDGFDETEGEVRAEFSGAPARPPYVVKVEDKSAEALAPAEPPVERSVETQAPNKAGLLRRRPLAVSLVALALAGALGAGGLWWDQASHFQTTDDAFIASRPITIAPKVAGYVTQVPVTDNQHVEKGEVIAKIDDRDYKAALDQANAQVAVAEANIRNIDAQIAVQQAQIDASVAQVGQAQANLTFANQQQARYEHLAQTGYGSVQNAQQYNSQQVGSEAAVKTAQANVAVARRQVEALKAQRQSAQANLDAARAQADQARLNLGYTTVTAAESGTIVSLGAAPGEFAAAGTNLTMFVPDETWVTANYKENQLDAMRPGQPVTLSIDAYPERNIKGHVASIQPGSGTAFSLLPAQNATGNYVKIVQRVPVKIIIDNPPSDVALGPGMSVEPSVRVDASPSLYERLTKLWSRA